MMRLPLILLLLVACGKDSVSSKTAVFDKQSGKEEAATGMQLRCEDDQAAELITFESYGTHGLEFSERLLLRCNGELEFRAWLPFSPEHMHRPGLYTGLLTAAEFERAKTLASELTQPTATPSLPPQGADTSVRIHLKDGPPLGHELRPDQNPADQTAVTMLQEWIARASTPKSAVELTLSAPEGVEFRKGSPATLLLALKNLSNQDVALTIDAASLGLRINRQPVESVFTMEWVRMTGKPTEGLTWSLAPSENVLAPLRFETTDTDPLEVTVEFEGELQMGDQPVRVRWRSQPLSIEAVP